MTFIGTRVVALFLTLTGVIAAPAAALDCENPVRVRISDDYLPFSYMSDHGNVVGLDVEFMRSVFQEIDCSYEFIDIPFKRSIAELAAGRIDMMPFMSITAERQAFARFSAAYRYETAGLVMREADVERYEISSLEDVVKHGLVLGHEHSAYRGEVFKDFLASPLSEKHVYIVSSTEEGVKMLLAGRIDALVEVPSSTLAMARQLGTADVLAEHPFQLLSEPVHFMFSRKTVSDELITAINGAIQELTSTNVYLERFGSMALREPKPEEQMN
ncbi:amino acid ABC transporter substrate-binding protein (PAAT family) [Roseibium hamelinense]|uniref:Amino acid ABC transporter substrate-binding protein (PAAT family) n=1 Tax=Roseibium hamelinense TaxID=150831 RepID=A0A562SU54_9HYPH|nr:transporter substrate-binding domain-containing protein [Roseibium hamelinense]TWI84792.1 amino acid ABC transporter substrate-binding protein (PAAT family) [Roseibium hamelinense]